MGKRSGKCRIGLKGSILGGGDPRGRRGCSGVHNSFEGLAFVIGEFQWGNWVRKGGGKCRMGLRHLRQVLKG